MNCISEAKELKSESSSTEIEFRMRILSVTIRKLKLDFTGLIGRGNFGDTIGVKLPTMERDVAVKVVVKENVGVNETQWASLNHRNILPLLESQYFTGLDVWLFITPIEPFTMRQLLRDKVFFSDAEAVYIVINWVKDILSGISYLHGKNLAYFNLKTSNVIISIDFTAKLYDFHFLNNSDTFTKSYNVPYIYRPPEAFKNKDADAVVAGRQFDIWSLGILAVNMFTQEYLGRKTSNRIPSWSEDIYPEIFKILQKGKFSNHYKAAFPEGHNQKEAFKCVRNFVVACLFFDPNRRFSAEKLLRHALFLKGGFLVRKDRIWVNKENSKILDERILKIFPVPELSEINSSEKPCQVAIAKSAVGIPAERASLSKPTLKVQPRLSGDSSVKDLKEFQVSTTETKMSDVALKPLSADRHTERIFCSSREINPH